LKKELKIALFIFATIFIIDQVVKFGFASLGWGATGSFMNLELAYNYGVAFSMLEFLAQYLKYIQLSIVVFATIYLIKNKDVFYKYYIPIALLYAGGLSNILDRFTYGAVVDYFAWHYMFEFAIFNFADVMIDLAVVIIIVMQIKESRKQKVLSFLYVQVKKAHRHLEHLYQKYINHNMLIYFHKLLDHHQNYQQQIFQTLKSLL
jgi:signal peptidase II